MEMANRDLLMGMFTEETIKTIDLMALVHMDGGAVPIMKEASKMGSGMGRVNGHQEKQNIQETMLKG